MELLHLWNEADSILYVMWVNRALPDWFITYQLDRQQTVVGVNIALSY